MSEETKTEKIYVRIDTNATSQDGNPSGIVVYYQKDNNQLVVKQHSSVIKGVRHKAKYVVYQILVVNKMGILWEFKCVEKCRFLAREPKDGYGIDFGEETHK